MLGSILLDGGMLRQVRTILAPADFYIGQHERIYQAMCDLADAGQAIDLVTLISRLVPDSADPDGRGRSMAYINELANGPWASNAPHYASIVYDASVRRQLIRSLSDGVRGAYELPGDVAIDTAHALLADLHATQAKGEAADMRSVADVALAGRGETWTFGIEELDAWTGGGLCHGDYHVIAGYTSTGKTHLGISVAYAAAMAGARVGYFSLEVSKRDLFWRLAGHVSGIDWRALQASVAPDSVRAEPRRRAIEQLVAMDNLWLFDRQRSVDQITVQTVAHGLDVAIVDYGQLVAATEKGERYDKNATAAERLQALAKQEGVAVVCFSQVNNESARAGAEHGGVIAAKGAGEWGSAATVFVQLYRDAWAVDPMKQAEVTFSIMKSQIGPSGCSCTRYLDLSTSRFRRAWNEPEAKQAWWGN